MRVALLSTLCFKILAGRRLRRERASARKVSLMTPPLRCDISRVSSQGEENPTVIVLVRVAQALGIEPAALLDGTSVCT
jgi:hypothetical protein